MSNFPLKSEEKPNKNHKDLSSKMYNNVPTVKKKHQYRQFIKLIKSGKFTTALATARIIGVDRRTISNWLQTKHVQLCLGEEVDVLVEKIKEAKDWRSKAYLLDKITENIEDETQPIIMEGLTIIRQ